MKPVDLNRIVSLIRASEEMDAVEKSSKISKLPEPNSDSIVPSLESDQEATSNTVITNAEIMGSENSQQAKTPC